MSELTLNGTCFTVLSDTQSCFFSLWIISKLISKLMLIYALLLYSEVVEYSLSKLLEKLQITQNEVRLKCSFRQLQRDLKAFIILCYTSIIFSATSPTVCWPVYFAGLWLLRQDSRFGSKESSDTDSEAPHYRECGFAYQQKGTILSTSDLCFSLFLYKNVWDPNKIWISAAIQTYPVPQFWKYKEARKLFLDAPQIEAPELIWTEPDEEALVQFLCCNKHIKYELMAEFLLKLVQFFFLST